MIELLTSDGVIFVLGAAGLTSTAISIFLDARAERARVAVSEDRAKL